VLVAVQGTRLVVVQAEAGGDRDPVDDAGILAAFGPGPVVVGPRAADLSGAHASAREALAGLRAAGGRPDAPRPVAADDLLPERALGGDPAAHRRLTDAVVAPLDAAGGELLRTLAVYIEGGGALEACARALYVHPNTVRYRLRRIGEITGHSPTDPRDSFVLRTALVVSRLQTWSKPPNS
jgi:DNA-binding PucR family transcriptional regulator